MSISKYLYEKLQNVPNSFEKLFERMEEASERRVEKKYRWKIDVHSFDKANSPSRMQLARVVPGFTSYNAARKRAEHLNTMTKQIRMSYPYYSENFRYEVVPIQH